LVFAESATRHIDADRSSSSIGGELMDAARRRDIDVVLVWRLDRYS
jgi:hypothetical protein